MTTMNATCGAHGAPADCAICLADERAAFATRGIYSAYVNEKTRTIQTWPGGELAKITKITRSRPLYTPTGGRYVRRYVQAVAPDGNRWHGWGSDEWDLVTLRRVKG